MKFKFCVLIANAHAVFLSLLHIYKYSSRINVRINLILQSIVIVNSNKVAIDLHFIDTPSLQSGIYFLFGIILANIFIKEDVSGAFSRSYVKKAVIFVRLRFAQRILLLFM